MPDRIVAQSARVPQLLHALHAVGSREQSRYKVPAIVLGHELRVIVLRMC
jgi:hypothetical protein